MLDSLYLRFFYENSKTESAASCQEEHGRPLKGTFALASSERPNRSSSNSTTKRLSLSESPLGLGSQNCGLVSILSMLYRTRSLVTDTIPLCFVFPLGLTDPPAQPPVLTDSIIRRLQRPQGRPRTVETTRAFFSRPGKKSHSGDSPLL